MTCALAGLFVLSFGMADDPAVFPAVGSTIPGPFHVYNATGPKKGTFTCPLTRFGLNPTVMVIVRGIEDEDGPEKLEGMVFLLRKLNNAVEKNVNTRLAAFAFFPTEKIRDVAREDEPREKLEEKLAELIGKGENEMKHLILGFDSKEKLARWNLDDKAAVTVLLMKDHRVEWAQTFSLEDFKTDAKAKEILGQAAKVLGARRL